MCKSCALRISTVVRNIQKLHRVAGYVPGIEIPENLSQQISDMGQSQTTTTTHMLHKHTGNMRPLVHNSTSDMDNSHPQAAESIKRGASSPKKQTPKRRKVISTSRKPLMGVMQTVPTVRNLEKHRGTQVTPKCSRHSARKLGFPSPHKISESVSKLTSFRVWRARSRIMYVRNSFNSL